MVQPHCAAILTVASLSYLMWYGHGRRLLQASGPYPGGVRGVLPNPPFEILYSHEFILCICISLKIALIFAKKNPPVSKAGYGPGPVSNSGADPGGGWMGWLSTPL